MNNPPLTPYEVSVIRSWSFDYALRAYGKVKPPVSTLVDDAALIAGFLIGTAKAELVQLPQKQEEIV